MRVLAPVLLLVAACAPSLSQVPSSGDPATVAGSRRQVSVVRPGIEVFLSDVPQRLRGKRVGLITNHTGIDASRASDIDLIARHKDLKLVALFAPEHGIRGTLGAGEEFTETRDAASELIERLRTENGHPAPRLEDVPRRPRGQRRGASRAAKELADEMR